MSGVGPSQPTRRATVTLSLAALLTTLLALACNLTLEVLQLGGDVKTLGVYTFGRAFPTFLLSSLILWFLILCAVALTGRLWLVVAMSFSLSAVVGYANYLKLQLRQEPIYPNELVMARQAGFLTQMVGFSQVAVAAGFCVLVFAVALLAGRLISQRFPRVSPRAYPHMRRRLYIARFAVAASCALLLVYVAQFNSDANKVRLAYESTGAFWKFWSQKDNYARNGVVAGFLYNLNVPAMEEPPGYDRKTMQQIAKRYSRIAEIQNMDRRRDAMKDVNVVLVLSEAFTDPTRVKGVHLDEDPIPFTRDLSSRSISGQMLTQMVGGGTANMEFEALTGFSLSRFKPQLNTPYQQLIPKYGEFPSIVDYMSREGHDALAIHPYIPSMYQRHRVYPILGFTKFLHEDEVQNRKLEDGRFVADDAVFAEIVSQLRANDDPLFLNVVTMQNHYPFHGQYRDPIPFEGLDNPVATEQASQYARGLKYTDDSLKRLVRSLNQLGEKTVLVFYGDHVPLFYSNTSAESQFRAMHETPFLIWRNFGTSEPRVMPTTSPIYFIPHVLELAGAPVVPYYALLEELQAEIPALGNGFYVDPGNRLVTSDQLTPRARQLLRHYELVQYDLTVGQRYSWHSMLDPSPADGVAANDDTN